MIFIKLKVKKEHYEVSFSKKIIPEVGIRKSILRFKSQNANPQFVDINYIDLHYTDKRVVKMTFSKIEESIIFSKRGSLFKFQKILKFLSNKSFMEFN